MQEYIVVLSLWNRGKWLQEQIDIFKNQTFPPKEIWLCYGLNEKNKEFKNSSLLKEFDCVKILEDGGSVFSRFEMAYKSEENLFFIIDDDMFPTKNYLENVINFYNRNDDCIIASSGRIFHNNKSYFPNTPIGSIKYSKSQQVHMGTNGWFLSKESIEQLLALHNKKEYNNCEDIALSFINLKKRKVKTYVVEQNELINSDKYKHARGMDEEALSHPSKHQEFYKQRNEVLNYYFKGDF